MDKYVPWLESIAVLVGGVLIIVLRDRLLRGYPKEERYAQAIYMLVAIIAIVVGLGGLVSMIRSTMGR